jgi:hypothetical protein
LLLISVGVVVALIVHAWEPVPQLRLAVMLAGFV